MTGTQDQNSTDPQITCSIDWSAEDPEPSLPSPPWAHIQPYGHLTNNFPAANGHLEANGHTNGHIELNGHRNDNVKPSLGTLAYSPISDESSPNSSTSSPKYFPGCFALAKLRKETSLADQSDLRQDPLSMRLKLDSEEHPRRMSPESPPGTSSLTLEVSCKNREPARRGDLDHLIGVVAREMRRIKEDAGSLPRFRCSGTRLYNRHVQFRFPDTKSLEFYKRVIRADSGPSGGHGGYYVRGAGDPPPFRKYRAWFPGQMMDSLDTVPDFLSLDSNDKLNERNIKIIGSSPSTSDGFMVYFEVSPQAETYISCFTSGVMCGAHKVRFCLVNDKNSGRSTGTRTPSPGSCSENWRVTSSVTSLSMEASNEEAMRTSESVEMVSEEGRRMEDRRYSAPDALQTQVAS